MSQTLLAEQSTTYAESNRDHIEAELINNLNLHLRVIEDANIELRKTIAAELVSFYDFLTKLFLPVEALKRPPREGWSSITSKRFAFLGKTESVIDLYRHIPYISQDDEQEYPMGPKCVCLDYTGRRFRTDALTPRAGKSQPPEALDQMKEQHKWSRLQAPQHIAVIAKPASSDGLYILVDMRDGRVASISPKYCHVQEWRSLTHLLTWVKQSFCALSIIPVSSLRVIDVANTYMSAQDVEQIKQTYRRHGWPTARFDKEACLADVGKVYDAFWQRSYGGGQSYSRIFFMPLSSWLLCEMYADEMCSTGSTRKRYSPSTSRTIVPTKGSLQRRQT